MAEERKVEIRKDEIHRILIEREVKEPDEAVEKLERYAGMLEERRSWAGLTSASLRENMSGWIMDSLAVLQVLPCEELKVLDIGSGGGLLGVILAVARPAWAVSMVESSSRKSAFLAEAVGALGLKKAEVLKARAEELAGAREFEACVSRAAGRLKEMVVIALPLLKPGGLYVTIKRADVGDEARDAERVVAEAGGSLSIRGPELSGRTGMSLVVVSKL